MPPFARNDMLLKLWWYFIVVPWSNT